MNLAIVGTERSGKTIALLLLHLTCTGLNFDRKIGYRAIVTPHGMDLQGQATGLKDGWPPLPLTLTTESFRSPWKSPSQSCSATKR